MFSIVAAATKITFRLRNMDYKWAVLAMLWFITFFNYADRMALNANMPLIREEMGLNKTTGGMLGSAFGYGYGLTAIFAGFIVDRVSRKKAVLLGLCIWSLICIAVATAPSFWFLFAYLVCEGLGEAFYFPAAISLLSDYHGQTTRARAMGINHTSVYFGTISGTYFAGILGHFQAGAYIRERWGFDLGVFSQYLDGWRSAFVIPGVFGITLGIVLWRFLYEPVRGAADLADAMAVGKPGFLQQHKIAPRPLKKEPFVNHTVITGLLLIALAFLLYFCFNLGSPPQDADNSYTILFFLKKFAPPCILLGLGFILLVLRVLRQDDVFLWFFKMFFSTPSAVLLLMAFVCANSVAVILLVWLPSFVYETVYGANDPAKLAMAGFLATMPLQLASMVGSPTGGLLADFLRVKTCRGRVAVQTFAMLCATPFVFMCGRVTSIPALILALAGWGLFKGIYDSNIYASFYDVIRPESRGMTVGIMNLFAWAGGGAIAPMLAGAIAERHSLGYAISATSIVYFVASILLFGAAMFFFKQDCERMQSSLAVLREEV